MCGRRAGKSFILALCAVFLAAFFDYRRYLSPGERGTVLIIATNSKQARVIVRYVRALLTQIPMLAKLIERETTDSFDLNNGTTIEVHHVSTKTTRGYTIVAVLADEIAFWPQEDAAEPDHEVLNALAARHGDDPECDVALRVITLTLGAVLSGMPIVVTSVRTTIQYSFGKLQPA